MAKSRAQGLMFSALFSCAALIALPVLDAASTLPEQQNPLNDDGDPQAPGEETSEEREEVEGLFADAANPFGHLRAVSRHLDVGGNPRAGHFGPLDRPPRT